MQHMDLERARSCSAECVAAPLRGAALRDRIPVLTAMAAEQGASAIDDVVPLLFHTRSQPTGAQASDNWSSPNAATRFAETTWPDVVRSGHDFAVAAPGVKQ
jgi:hypothetical protein